MKISIRHLVVFCLGAFLLKIAVADPYRQSERERAPAAVRTQSLN